MIRGLSDLRESGGANRDRTDDLLHAMQALYQLSYGPFLGLRTSNKPPPHPTVKPNFAPSRLPACQAAGAGLALPEW